MVQLITKRHVPILQAETRRFGVQFYQICVNINPFQAFFDYE